MMKIKNKLILVICFSISFAGCLFFVCFSFAQQGSAQSVEVVGYSFNRNSNTMSKIEYGVVVAKRFLDTDNLARYLDPSGLSYLEALRVDNGIGMDLDEMLAGVAVPKVVHPTSAYFMDFDELNSQARFSRLRSNRFMMSDDGPDFLDAQRGFGKYVYDIAEAVHVTDAEAGDVVVISSKEDITLIKSSKKFDTKVAGVISTEPKVYMGHFASEQEPEKYKPLALAGIVLCKVTAENGAIKKGDYLVSSSLPGHAMRAESEQITPGMVLGSALGELEQGQGQIYILVN